LAFVDKFNSIDFEFGLERVKVKEIF
jgi:hypothetical protein